VKVGEIITELIKGKNYLTFRLTLDDDMIDFIKENMPREYEYFREKEEAFKFLRENLS